MIKSVIAVLALTLIPFSCVADEQQPLMGWHWYNKPVKKQIKKRRDESLIKAFNQLSPLQQLKILQMATNNLRAKAVLTGNVRDIAAYKQAQDFWVSRATQFTVGWEKMLLIHPELNYGLQFSHENALAPIMQRNKHAREDAAISSLASNSGLLLFYRGKNKEDQLFTKIVSRYSKRHHLVVIPVSVDGVLSSEFTNNPQLDGMQKARALGIRYFPAVILVNPTTNRHEIVSFGFKSEDELSDRLLKITDGWKAEF